MLVCKKVVSLVLRGMLGRSILRIVLGEGLSMSRLLDITEMRDE